MIFSSILVLPKRFSLGVSETKGEKQLLLESSRGRSCLSEPECPSAILIPHGIPECLMKDVRAWRGKLETLWLKSQLQHKFSLNFKRENLTGKKHCNPISQEKSRVHITHNPLSGELFIRSIIINPERKQY